MICFPQMRECLVEILGDDGEVHDISVDAVSLFDAAEQALRYWAHLSWFNPNTGLTVRSGPDYVDREPEAVAGEEDGGKVKSIS